MNKNKLVRDTGILGKFIANNQKEQPWTDTSGNPLSPPFQLKTGGAMTKDKFAWPPSNYEQLKVLSATLQSAHLFLTLLSSAGRVGEIETLQRSCVCVKQDGKDYVRGWTYKLSGNLFGESRQWPAPKILLQVLGQQARLANVWNRLPSIRIEDGLPKTVLEPEALWLSLGSASRSNTEVLGNSRQALRTLAMRIDMDPKPDGINLHPHRLRKTIGRIAGITLFDSPLVLKRLFGHKSIEMTLHYILCDKDIRTEAETVLRELRILHCAETLEEVRESLAKGEPLPGHIGVAALKLVDAIKEHEDRLVSSGRMWVKGSAYELAFLLTSKGQGWRFVQKNIICTKIPGEGGLCRKNKGEPNTSNCKAECENRLVLALERRNSGEVVECYIDVATQARADEQYMVFYESMQRLLEQLNVFPDLKSFYLKDLRFQSLLTSFQELGQ